MSFRQRQRQPPQSVLGRRQRNAARTSLYVSLALVAALVAAVYLWMVPRFDFGLMTEWSRTDWGSLREVQLLREYVAIDTSPSGEAAAGTRWFADRLRRLGLSPVVEEVGGEANAWAILEGEERGAVVLHHHVDVESVPVGEHWFKDAFSGEIDGPWMYGRGTFDMKSVAIAQLLAVEKLLAELDGRRPRRSLIVLATTGEEHGSDLGTRWVVQQHPELVERFEVVLTEGGAVEGRTRESFKYWGTEVAQKRLVVVEICGAAREPLAELERDMRRTGGYFTEPELVPEVERFMRSYAPTRDARHLRQALGDPRALFLDRATFESLSSYLKGYFRNVAVPQGLFENEDGWRLRIHLLLLPGAAPERVVSELLPPWTHHALAMSAYEDGGAFAGSSPDHWAFHTIQGLIGRRFPGVEHGPLVLPSTITDARFLRAAGVTTFGFSPFNVLTPEVTQLRHYGTVNERIELPGYVSGVELYGELLSRLVE